MAGFRDILGQKSVIAHMKKAVSMGSTSHAYILNGEKGMGKKLLAHAFSMTLQCEQGGDEPCMECRSCKQTEGRNHPDIKWITHEKPNTISVEEVRDQLVNDMAIKPYSGKYKIYIIDEGEKMTPAAQNTLLKTIEEPPAYGIVIILTSNKEMLLQTILSRCVSLNLRPLKDEEMKRYLIAHENVPDYQAATAVKFAGGNLGRAIDIISSDDFIAMKDDVVRALKNVYKMTASDINQLVKEHTAYKNDMDAYLNLIIMWFRDVLLYKASGRENCLMFEAEATVIEKQAREVSYDGVQEILVEIDNLKSRLKSNVNFEITLELLFIKIREAFNFNSQSA